MTQAYMREFHERFYDCVACLMLDYVRVINSLPLIIIIINKL